MRAAIFLGSFLLISVFSVSYASADEPPNIESFQGPENGTIENPLWMRINASDPEGGNLTISWFLDGELVGSGNELRYYLFPGIRNVTVVITDQEGNTIQRSWMFSGIPPPGWGEKPDNDGNRAIFWAIFGISGAILMAVLIYTLFRKREGQFSNMERKRP